MRALAGGHEDGCLAVAGRRGAALGRGGGRGDGHLVPEVWERLDDEVPELEEGADLILQLLEGDQRLGLLAYQVVKRPGAQGHAVHATDDPVHAHHALGGPAAALSTKTTIIGLLLHGHH